MTSEPKRFFFSATILLGISVAISQIIFSTIFVTYFFPARIISIIFVWLITCAFHYWVMKTVTDKPKAFTGVFMLQAAIKLLLYITCIAVYLFVYREQGVPFTVHFLIVYLVFTIFEVASIFKFVKDNSGQTPGSVKKYN